MNKTLSHVFKTEEEARKLIEQAKEKAASILKETDAEIQRRAIEKHTEARELIHREIEIARKEAAAVQREVLRKAEREKANFLNGKEELVGSLTDKIVEIITTPEYLKYIKKV
ncbi:MAG: hypothetical protein DRP57_07155 [Spirochaetes bacterium]|nr:MAG: hypothetical protein DRP57_07155 [Spirochaetota bacterium]